MQRATIQSLWQITVPVGRQLYASIPFGQLRRPAELKNIKEIHWDRSVDTDTATCKLVLYNTRSLPIGELPSPGDGGFDQQGYYSPARGHPGNRWGTDPNGWENFIMPDRVIRTYEGYGHDRSVPPELDPHLVPSGLWLIDDVEFTADGLINVSCRDGSRQLHDCICFPPVVPLAYYPLHFDHYATVPNPPAVTGSGWSRPSYGHDSGVPYVGRDGSIHGHRPTNAMDSSDSSYWLSIGNSRPSAGYSFEFIEGHMSARTVSAVRYRVWGGPYRVYLSLKVGGHWIGTNTVPYDPNHRASAPNGANVRYYRSAQVGYESTNTFSFTPVNNVTAVRLCFTGLYNSHVGRYSYRAGVRDMQISGSHTVTTPGGTRRIGNYGDYTDIVKLLLAYGGFYWPRDANLAVRTRSNGTTYSTPAPSDDPVLGKGRIWGDLENSGTFGPASLTSDIFDKKPLIDGIAYIRDMIGFNFFIDESGGAIFRSPNIWRVGNYVGGTGAVGYDTDPSHQVTIDENDTLMSLSATMSSRSTRERVFIANTSGLIGALAKGTTAPAGPHNANLRRVGGWTDEHFTTKQECQIMADLIVIRQLFSYRSDRLRIPGYSAIQIDDQVRIYESTTAEDHLHYIKGISSSWDIETGEWTYDLDTHWLGSQPFSNWFFNPADLAPETLAYLKALGQVG